MWSASTHLSLEPFVLLQQGRLLLLQRFQLTSKPCDRGFQKLLLRGHPFLSILGFLHTLVMLEG